MKHFVNHVRLGK